MLKNLNFRIWPLVTKNIVYKHTLVKPGKGKHLFLLWKLNIKMKQTKIYVYDFSSQLINEDV